MSLVFFILAPFLTFIASCTNLERRANQIVFVLFFALFGYCHTFEDTRADSYRKYIKFNNYTTQDVGSIIGDFTDGDTKDIFEELLFSVTKSLTDNPHILMMLVGLFGGFFRCLIGYVGSVIVIIICGKTSVKNYLYVLDIKIIN